MPEGCQNSAFRAGIEVWQPLRACGETRGRSRPPCLLGLVSALFLVRAREYQKQPSAAGKNRSGRAGVKFGASLALGNIGRCCSPSLTLRVGCQNTTLLQIGRFLWRVKTRFALGEITTRRRNASLTPHTKRHSPWPRPASAASEDRKTGRDARVAPAFDRARVDCNVRGQPRRCRTETPRRLLPARTRC